MRRSTGGFGDGKDIFGGGRYGPAGGLGVQS
jgi:hypothetical protein